MKKEKKAKSWKILGKNFFQMSHNLASFKINLILSVDSIVNTAKFCSNLINILLLLLLLQGSRNSNN